MLQELKKISLKKVLPICLIFLALGVVMLVLGGPGLLLLLGGPKDLDSVPVDQLEGQYVRTDMAIVMDWYAYTEEKSSSGTRRTTAKEYVIPVGEREYMGVELPASKISQADALIDATWDYLSDEDADFLGEPLTVSGTIVRMDSESLKFYHETVGYDDMDAATQQVMLPLVLKSGQVGDNDLFTVCFFAGSGLLLVGFGLFFLLRALTGGYQKSLKTYCAEKMDAAMELERLETFYNSAELLYGVRMDDTLLMIQDGATTRLLPVEQVVWAYQQTTQHRTNGIPTGKTHALMLNLENGKQLAIGMKEDQARELLAAFDQRYPNMLLGYTKERAELYRKDRTAFCRSVRERSAQPTAAASQPAAGPEM